MEPPENSFIIFFIPVYLLKKKGHLPHFPQSGFCHLHFRGVIRPVHLSPVFPVSWKPDLETWADTSSHFLAAFLPRDVVYVPLFSHWCQQPSEYNHRRDPWFTVCKMVIFSFLFFLLHLLTGILFRENLYRETSCYQLLGYPEVQFVQERWPNAWFFPLTHQFSDQVRFLVVSEVSIEFLVNNHYEFIHLNIGVLQ